jgi:sarcosine oxidase subunit beta
MKSCLAFYKKARELGSTFITGEKVVKINKIEGKARSVFTERGNTYEGGKIIVAAASGSRPIINTVGIDIPMRNSYVTCWVTEPSPYISEYAYNGMSSTNYYGHQTRHGSWMFGGSGCNEAFFPNVTSSDYGQALQNSVNLVIKEVSEDIPLIARLKIVRTWSALVDKSSDEAPTLGKVEEVPELILYCASHGIGFCIGPAVGYVLSELAADMEPSVDVKSLNPNRFDYMKKNPHYLHGKDTEDRFKW